MKDESMNKTKNAVRNIFWGFWNRIFLIILPFVMRTVLIYTMGNEYVGLNSLFTSILSVLSLSELGFSSAIVYSLYKPIAENDKARINAIVKFYRDIYHIIGYVIAILGLAVLPFLKNFISGTYPSEINIYVLYLIYLANTSVGYFLFAYKKAILAASQRNDIESNVSTITTVLQYGFQIGLLIVFRNYYVYCIILPLMTVLNNLIISYYVNKNYPYIKCEGKLERSFFDTLKKQIVGLVTQKIGTTVISSIDSIVISSFLGLVILAQYTNYYYILSAIVGILAIITSSIMAGVGNSLVTKSKEENYTQFKTFNFMYVWIVSWFSACMLCIYQPFMRIWVGEENTLPMGIVVLFVVYFYVYKQNDMCGIYKQAAGIWWEGKFMPLVAAGVNLVVNIILVLTIGLSGILLSTIISLLLVYFPWGTWILYHNCFDIQWAYRNHLLRQFGYGIGAIVVCVITYAVCGLLPDNIFGLVARFVVCAIIPNVVLTAIYCWTSEFKNARIFVKIKILKR